MKNILVILLCSVLASCTATKDTAPDPTGSKGRDGAPIDTLVKRLHASKGIWQNGGSPEIDLPQDAEPKDVIERAIRWQPFDQGMIKSYKIEEIRQVDLFDINGKTEQYTAALLHTDFGPKVIVFNFKTFNRWWARFYPVEKEKQNQ